MTSTTASHEVLKQDRRGRVRVSRERREALLDEFSRSGLSAAEFARMAGIKYPTFANWLQERRKVQPPVAEE
ncbi:MAG: IS66 family insertion sequence element accessory protein TnpB, partial [Chthoniobacter sp.]